MVIKLTVLQRIPGLRKLGHDYFGGHCAGILVGGAFVPAPSGNLYVRRLSSQSLYARDPVAAPQAEVAECSSTHRPYAHSIS